MNPNPEYAFPVVYSILLPADFSAGSLTAFHHALKAAIIANAKLTILHLSPEAATAWTDFSGVRETLERWGLLTPDSPKDAVPEMGIDVRTVVAPGGSPAKAVLGHLETNPTDLIVLSIQAHEGRATWLRQPLIEPIARKAEEATLFLPDTTPGFVSARDGSVSLERILIPIAAKPRPQSALAAAARLAVRLQRPRGTFILMHVGDKTTMPAVQCPEVPGWEWKKVMRTGDVIQGIADTVAKESADLIVMCTDGRNGFLDALRGSYSERVLRNAPCPLLTVPEAGGALK